MHVRLLELEGRIERREAELAVIGLGYVGLPLALAFARAGFRVTGIDLDERKIARLQAGQSYVEDVADDEITAQLQAGRFTVTTALADAARPDCLHICVPTPLRKTKDPDVSYIVAAIDQIRRSLRAGQLIVLGSTTYPGTTHELYRPMLESSGLSVGKDFALAFAPERVDPGNDQWSFHEVPKVVGGETQECTRLAARLFSTVFREVVPVSSSQAAEMVKLLENTFRMINIGLANEFARICDRLGLDVWEIIDAAATKPYGFMKFVPGPGLGGHCIPVDPRYLAWKLRSLDFSARFIELATEINQGMPIWVVERATRMLNRLGRAVNGSRILLLGVAFKRGVSDYRESPALSVLSELVSLGAQVEYHDPHVPELELGERAYKSVPLTDALLRDCDLAIITTDHPELDYARVVRHCKLVLDTRNATAGLEAPNVEKL